jgi:hypothetical protein
MKLAFIGDSFCANIGIDTPTGNVASGDWPAIVAKQLNAEIIQGGQGGSHFYASINKFLPSMFEADVVVFCVTEPYRVYNRFGLPITAVWGEQIHSKSGIFWEKRHENADELNIPMDELLNIAEAVDLYYNYLFHNQYAEFFNIGFISFIDKILKECNKKTIWFPCFNESFSLPAYKDSAYSKPKTPLHDMSMYHSMSEKIDNGWYYYIPKSGPSANIPLHIISIHELADMQEKDRDEHLRYDPRRNHMNEENNYVMANMIVDIIKNDKFSPDIIKMEDYFSHIDFSRVERMRT